MNESRASKTARQMALSRALEARRPAAERICFDPFAEQLVSGAYRTALLTRPLRHAVEHAIEALFPGHHHYVLARTRHFDEFLGRQLATSSAQLVILGAGFDSRAHRFADRLRGVTVFEVDHPATSAAKRETLRGIRAALDEGVVYVPVDFNVQTLPEELRRAGFADQRRTIFLWEGVTPYLSAAAVDDVLAFIRCSTAPGSALLFDYILRSVLDESCAMRGARNEHRKMSRTAEPFTFGIASGAAATFLGERGFRDVVDVGADELTRSYFGPTRRAYVKPWWRIVEATVA